MRQVQRGLLCFYGLVTLLFTLGQVFWNDSVAVCTAALLYGVATPAAFGMMLYSWTQKSQEEAPNHNRWWFLCRALARDCLLIVVFAYLDLYRKDSQAAWAIAILLWLVLLRSTLRERREAEATDP